MKGKRIEYLDTIKGIAIILVVFCHTVLMPDNTIVGNILMTFAWGAVPCFFMVTGGLMHKSEVFQWKKYFSKVARIYGVLCGWKIIYLFMYYYMVGNIIEFSKVELVKYVFFFANIDGVSTGLMWFMHAYIIAILFFPISHFLFHGGEKGNKILAFILCLFFISGMLIYSVDLLLECFSKFTNTNLMSVKKITTVIPFGKYQNMLVYFVLGAYLLKFQEKLEEILTKKRIYKWIPVGLIVVGTAGLMLVKYYYARPFYWEQIYIEEGYHWCSTIILSLGMYLIVQMNPSGRVQHFLARYVGTHTMGIYFLHWPFWAACVPWFTTYLLPYYSVGLNIVKTMIFTVGCFLITIFAKHIPIMKRLFI